MQSKKYSHYEISINQIVGAIGGWLIVYLLFPLFNHFEQATIATISSLIFFIWSYTRSYILRRIFNKVHDRSTIKADSKSEPTDKKDK